MKVPETPITPLPETATLRDTILKINEVIKAINDMWNPDDGTDL